MQPVGLLTAVVISATQAVTNPQSMTVNENKSTHITFTLRKGQCPQVSINQTVIPRGTTVKYLGLHFDRKLTWKEHIITKRKQLDQR